MTTIVFTVLAWSLAFLVGALWRRWYWRRRVERWARMYDRAELAGQKGNHNDQAQR